MFFMDTSFLNNANLTLYRCWLLSNTYRALKCASFFKMVSFIPPNVDLLKIDFFSPSETAFQSICKLKHTQIKLK